MDIQKALEQTRTIAPQTKVTVARGLTLRRTKNKIPVLTLHYSSDPYRDPELNPEWKKIARATYSSQAAWDREQEIVDNAGGGQLVFADALITHWKKIVITDPGWRPDQGWSVLGGFDHGKTNPTALERAYVDYAGNIIICGEYYQPGLDIWQHAPELLKFPDVQRMDPCWADPSVFDQKTQQEQGKVAKSFGEVYEENGVSFLTAFRGNRNEQTFAERLLSHWSDLENREPTVKIVCRNYTDRPQYGAHPWDCPNLLWELLQTRRKKLTAQQLMTQNRSEEIIDKNNHARDCLKYLLMSQPEPAKKSIEQRLAEHMEKYDDLTTAMAKRGQMMKEIHQEEQPIYMGRNGRQLMAGRDRRRRQY